MTRTDCIRSCLAIFLSGVALMPAQAEPIAVELITATPSPASQTLSLTGEIVARDAVTLSFPSGGRLVDIRVQAGQQVAAGDILAQVDPVQFESRLRAAEAGVTRAEADLAQTGDEADRQARLLRQGATTRARSDNARAAADAASAALTAAQAELDSARKALDDTILRAPASGSITTRKAEPGQVIAPAQPVLEFAGSTGFDAVFDVPEPLMSQARPSSAQIGLELIDISAPPFSGMVTEVSPRIDPARGTVEVRAAIEGLPPGVVLGAAVRGFASVEGSPRITLPVWAVTALGDGPAVWAVDPDTLRAHRQPIEVLRYSSDSVVIADGIAAGTLIVGRGAQLVYEGRELRDAAAAVQPAPTEAP